MSTLAEAIVKREIRELKRKKRQGTRRNKPEDPKNYKTTTLNTFGKRGNETA